MDYQLVVTDSVKKNQFFILGDDVGFSLLQSDAELPLLLQILRYRLEKFQIKLVNTDRDFT